MATRSFIREKLVSLLYSYEVGNDDLNIKEELLAYKIKNKALDFATDLYESVISNKENIDNLIKEHVSNDELKDMGYMELSILRLGICELQKQETERAIIINEAIELSKKFCKENSSKLINAILDKIII